MAFESIWADVNIGEPAQAAGLKVFPLYPRKPSTLQLELLPAAVARGAAALAEADGAAGAWFRSVLLTNSGERAVLVRDGDLLVGGRQDRSAERSCVVAARSQSVIPALCVELNRSHYNERKDFTVSTRSADPEMRYSRISSAQRGDADLQQETWSQVAARRRSRKLGDDGGSLTELENSIDANVRAVEARLPAVWLASGVAAAWRGPEGRTSWHVELFADSTACAQVWPSIIRAATECVRDSRPPRVSRTELRKLFDGVSRGVATAAPDVGVGRLTSVHADSGVGTVLVIGGELAHASLLAA